MRAALRQVGVAAAPRSRFRIVLTNDYLADELIAINDSALKRRSPWLLVKTVGEKLHVGPLFRPGETACWECLAHRLRANRPLHEFARRLGTLVGRPTSQSAPAIDGIAERIAASELRNHLDGLSQGSSASVISIDTPSWSMRRDDVRRRLQCTACGCSPRKLRSMFPIFDPSWLATQPKIGSEDAMGRVRTPDETYAAYEYLVNPVTGIMPAVSSVGSAIAPVFVAGHNAALRFERLKTLANHIRNRSAGKGRTQSQARTGALCEAVERYSAVFQGYERTQRTTLRKLGEQAIDPTECLLFSDRQYDLRQAHNAVHPHFNRIPERFDATIPILWSPLYSLTRNMIRFLPTSLLYFGSAQLPAEHARFCSSDSNGNASGNTHAEAILQGLCELIERDAVALWWYNRDAMLEIDLDSFEDPYFSALRSYYGSLSPAFWVLDLTSDIGVTACVAISRRLEGPQQDIILGFGAHLSPRLAVQRAVTEMNQLLPHASDSNRRRAAKGDTLEEFDTWCATATVEALSYLRPAGRKTFSDLPELSSDDVVEDLNRCRRLVEQQGIEVLVLDHTRPDIGMPVVKVVAPGMRHFWARLAPGRLYDVPVKLGRVARPRSEEELNDIHMFL